MFKWVAILLCLVVMGCCFGAMGVGKAAMIKLGSALGLMASTSLVIAWVCLRNHSPREDP